MGDVTDEELVQIATNFLLASPPGEFMDVVTGMNGVIAMGILHDKWCFMLVNE